MKLPYEEFDLSGVRTYPLASRTSKANAADFARPYVPGSGMRGVARRRCPRSLGAADFKAVVAAMRAAPMTAAGRSSGASARTSSRPASGRCSIDLMERGFVSALATNGAGVIHDFELALSGSTSEDVDEALGPGRFGMAEETGRLLNAAINDGVAARPRASARRSATGCATRARHTQHLSVVAAAARLEIPVTVHVGIGTDIIHMHPAASGAALGEGSLRDFRYFVSNVGRLGGGVFLNCGSAVILPEVFLKAVALARNRGIASTG